MPSIRMMLAPISNQATVEFMTHTAKEKAKAIIVEIIRQNGGTLRNKTNLFKAFWKAHVAFCHAGYLDLSGWRIVRMPNGPGIDRFDVLLGELLASGTVETENIEYGDGCVGFAFHLRTRDLSELNQAEIDAVRAGVNFVNGLSAAAVSHMSHKESRSWNSTKDGDELDVTLDAIPEEEYARMRQRFAETRGAFDNEVVRAQF